MKKLELKVSEGTQELVLRTGEAPVNFKVRKGIEVFGTIGVPLAHLEKNTLTATGSESFGDIEILEPGDNNVIDESYLTVDRELMKIVFRENAGKDYESIYEGKLEFTAEILDFGINDPGKQYKPLKLAEKIKMNQSRFESKTAALSLVNQLVNFEAKVNKDVQDKNDGRANTKMLRAQSVQTNIPEGFNMKMPVFKGGEEITFLVEIYIDPYELTCSLVSPELNMYVIENRDRIIDAQLDAIKKLHEGLRIFEI